MFLIMLSVYVQSLDISSDPDSTRAQFPLYSITILQSNYTRSDPRPIDGANWIWVNSTSREAVF